MAKFVANKDVNKTHEIVLNKMFSDAVQLDWQIAFAQTTNDVTNKSKSCLPPKLSRLVDVRPIPKRNEIGVEEFPQFLDIYAEQSIVKRALSMQ